VAAAVCAVGALLAAGNLPVRSTAITGWDPGYPLLLGNEMTGDRPWRGTIENLALVPGSLRSAERRAVTDGGVAADAVVLARAAFDTSVAMFLDGGAALRLPDESARVLAQAAQAENALTIVARIVPATVDQKGPARIVSFSTDPQHRNFDLGQEGRTLVFRIRTPFSGGNGTRRPVVSAPVLEAGRPVTVVGAYDGRVARLYIDGRLSGRENFAAEASAGSTLADEVLPAVCAVMGALLALIARSVVVGRGRRSTVVAALAAGAVTLALPVLAPGIAAAMAAVPWSGVGGLIGVGAVLAARE